MVEVQSRKPYAKRQKSNARVWACVWRCFACVTALSGCCCCCCRGGEGTRISSSARTTRNRFVFWSGVALLVIGGSLAIFWAQILDLIVYSELKLSPRSISFKVWQSTPIPLRLDFYFWNWTNPEDINKPGVEPSFAQMGPYCFKETKEKVDIKWNENGTISFRQLRYWYFDAENSAGSMADNVTTVNAVSLTAAHVVRDWNFLLQRSVSLALDSTNQKVSLTRTVGQFLFEGYEDPLITIATKVPGLASVNIPFDRFGWFYMRNGSAAYDGVFNMQTGASDMGRLGELSAWNSRDHTPFYSGECAALRGSAGELWPPGRSSSDTVSLFSPDLCRSVSLQYTNPVKVAGIDGLRFSGGPLMLDNGQLDEDNACYCDGECVAGGVANVSACRYGAPAFVSFPHFYLADPSYRRAVRGMRPNAENHSFFIALEPTYGIPLDVAARFQINLLLQRNEEINMLSNVPERLMFPVIWFEQRAAITPELATPLRLLLHFPLLALVAAGVMLLSGLSCLVGPLLLSKYKGRRGRRHAQRANLAAIFAANDFDSGSPTEKDGQGLAQPVAIPTTTSSDSFKTALSSNGHGPEREKAKGDEDAAQPLLPPTSSATPASSPSASSPTLVCPEKPEKVQEDEDAAQPLLSPGPPPSSDSSQSSTSSPSANPSRPLSAVDD